MNNGSILPPTPSYSRHVKQTRPSKNKLRKSGFMIAASPIKTYRETDRYKIFVLPRNKRHREKERPRLLLFKLERPPTNNGDSIRITTPLLQGSAPNHYDQDGP
ncbi:hypothetical protein CEXT_241561 [Caerostris extrusa]|uniref:Uncharacterized protein n=1 Tax=Caerostris extrusa TaxID=172846 RepID=A0AAV4P669_CAEEX|nr:hypothetical protein CEXT_241561 [Caerostris extrusa]